MKIAIFGGSFNPIHNGHIEMVKLIKEQLNPNKILIIPALIPPHKSSCEYASANHRMKMCALAFEEQEYVEISDIEINANQISYTYKTLLKLKEEYKDAEFFLICGTDMFLTLKEWKNPGIIFENATICAFTRDNAEDSIMKSQKSALEKMGARVVLCKGDIPAISSTMIRERVKAGEKIDSFVPSAVLEYIYNNEIYR